MNDCANIQVNYKHLQIEIMKLATSHKYMTHLWNIILQAFVSRRPLKLRIKITELHYHNNEGQMQN
jgi:hypothetical protein